MRVVVHDRVTERHPDISGPDVQHAFRTSIASVARTDVTPTQWLGVGMDSAGRLLEYVAVQLEADCWLVFHCMEATKKSLREVGINSTARQRGSTTKRGSGRRRRQG